MKLSKIKKTKRKKKINYKTEVEFVFKVESDDQDFIEEVYENYDEIEKTLQNTLIEELEGYKTPSGMYI